MATKQHSNSRKLRNKVKSSSKRSDWAAGMRGADPEWLHSRQARELAQVFDGHFPAWLIESEPWRPVTGARFRLMRATILRLTTEQCAAYLGIHRTTICRWESGEIETPRAAFEALRLLCASATQRLSHKHWDGWFINSQTGELVSPDVGRLSVKPEEINGLPALYHRLSILMLHVEKLESQVDALEVENASLRGNAKSRQIAAELESMQERIAGLLASVRTAEIIEFNHPAAELSRATG
ncbi:hypothetical protein [Azonexus hydrophilus]|uniref:hypothetical protein n=1 Tax=Azonexus hydrophilus TaxID=418702 RepID=UPI0012F8CA88|nr:hypothetical protein [Azonexus hydrophilus]